MGAVIAALSFYAVKLTYLRGRGISCDLPRTLRFHPETWHGPTARRWPAMVFAGDGAEVLAGLLDRGLLVATGQSARQAMLDLLQRWQPAARAVTSDRLGWADETCAAFICGNGRVIGAEAVVFQSESVPAAAAEMRPQGTLEGWREAVAARCTGNPLMVAAVSLAFAGPLLEPLGMEGGGLHLRGASSRGKSTLQRVAVSVWGSPRFLHSWRATANGLEGVAAACNGSLLALDELGEISGRDAGKAAYMLANGTGKTRADRNGLARPALRWRVMVLSSGEITLADKMAEDGRRPAAGQAVRLLDVAADDRRFGAFDDLHGAPDGAAFFRLLREATSLHFGTADPAFVEALISRRSEVEPMLRASIKHFHSDAAERFGLRDDGQTARAADRLGLVAAAGETATAYGLTGWPPGAALEAALEVLGSWIAARGGVESAEKRDAIERVRAFLVAHGEARFEPIGDVAGRPVANRAGWREGTTYYIAADSWREIHAGGDPGRAARHLLEVGLLTAGEGRNLAARAPRSIPGRPRVYAVSAEIMGAGNE